MKIANVSELREIRRRIGSLPEVTAKIAKRVAEAFTRLSEQAFDAQRRPDGGAWEAGENGTPKLNRTGRLRAAATRFEAVGSTVRASVGSVPYARYQARRGFLPTKTLPAEWAEVARQIAREEIDRHMRGAS